MISAMGFSLPGAGRSVRLEMAGDWFGPLGPQRDTGSWQQTPPGAFTLPQFEPSCSCSATRRARRCGGVCERSGQRVSSWRAAQGTEFTCRKEGRAGLGWAGPGLASSPSAEAGPGAGLGKHSSWGPPLGSSQAGAPAAPCGQPGGPPALAMARRFLALVAGCLLSSAFGIVPEPKNVRINSFNLNSTLQWDPPTFHKENITYTVESISSLYNRNLCKNIVITECDFSSLSVYGNYTLRVRAESENEESDWVNTIFKPLDDTIIGPPDIKVKSESGSLHVDFTGPVVVQGSDKWPLKKYYGSWAYRVLYWKKSNSEEVVTTDTKYNSEILSGLDPWTIYCLQVQAVIPEWNKTGELSEEFCDRTTDNGVTPVWITVTVLLVSMLVVLVSVPACFFTSSYIYRQTRYVFCPKYSLPQHLKEVIYCGYVTIMM
ncbi:interleukin-10 receptor subunit beta isoform X3 [Caretta caretta]|uniref:interleukin-10 receptor subunit beta isoform X3 n=1 Tax=Caretta caretta TaxID=8467 RepID=UPI003F4B8BEB